MCDTWQELMTESREEGLTRGCGYLSGVSCLKGSTVAKLCDKMGISRELAEEGVSKYWKS